MIHIMSIVAVVLVVFVAWTTTRRFVLSVMVIRYNWRHCVAGFEDDKSWNNAASSESVASVNNDDKVPEVVLRRTQSFEADDK